MKNHKFIVSIKVLVTWFIMWTVVGVFVFHFKNYNFDYLILNTAMGGAPVFFVTWGTLLGVISKEGSEE